MNYRLFHTINSAAGHWPPADAVMRFAATDLIFLVFAAAVLLALRSVVRRRIRPVVCLGATLTLASLLARLLATAGHERRPFQDHRVHQLISDTPNISMPSVNATAACTLAFGVLLFLNRRAGLALTATAAVIGFAEVWAGRHYPGDIAAAALIAALSVFAVHVSDRGAPDRTPAAGPAAPPPRPGRATPPRSRRGSSRCAIARTRPGRGITR